MYEQAGAAAGAAGAQGGPTPEAGPAPEGFNGDDVVERRLQRSLECLGEECSSELSEMNRVLRNLIKIRFRRTSL